MSSGEGPGHCQLTAQQMKTMWASPPLLPKAKMLEISPILICMHKHLFFFLIVTKTGWSFVFSFSIKCEVSAVFVKFVLLFS